MYYNKAVNKKTYYESLFMNIFKHENHSKKLYDKKKTKEAVFFSYPVWLKKKKVIIFRNKGYPLRKKSIKCKYNINQTVLLESYISRNKVFFHIPLTSRYFNIS